MSEYISPRFSKEEIISVVERELPSFAESCKTEEAEAVVMTQAAFGADYLMGEFIIFAFAIKYAEIYGKNVHIITKN